MNAPTLDVELEEVRESVRRERPYGSSDWARQTARALGLEASLGRRGRPRLADRGEDEGEGG